MKKQKFIVYKMDLKTKQKKEYIHFGYLFDGDIAIEENSYDYDIYKQGYKVTTIKKSNINKINTPLRAYKHYIKSIKNDIELKDILIKITRKCKKIKDAKIELKNNNIDYVEFEGIRWNELQVNKGCKKWFRLVQYKNNLVIKEMKTVQIGGAESSLKASLIQEKLSYK
jgi:hypothetical protein